MVAAAFLRDVPQAILQNRRVETETGAGPSSREGSDRQGIIEIVDEESGEEGNKEWIEEKDNEDDREEEATEHLVLSTINTLKKNFLQVVITR